MIRSVFYCSDNGKKEEFVKKTDHEKDKAEAVLAERKATKDEIVEMLDIKDYNSLDEYYLEWSGNRRQIDMNDIYNSDQMVEFCQFVVEKLISKIEEEVK